MCECVHLYMCVRGRNKMRRDVCTYVMVYLGLHEGTNTIFQLSRQL